MRTSMTNQAPDVNVCVAAGHFGPASHFGDDPVTNEEELLDDADSANVLVLNRGEG
jgi:hypothetical protein